MKQASVRGAIGGGEALASRPDLNPVLPTISVPTLILVGREDNVPPVEVARKMNAGIRGSRLVVTPGAVHAAIIEKSATANRVVLGWAATVR